MVSILITQYSMSNTSFTSFTILFQYFYGKIFFSAVSQPRFLTIFYFFNKNFSMGVLIKVLNSVILCIFLLLFIWFSAEHHPSLLVLIFSFTIWENWRSIFRGETRNCQQETYGSKSWAFQKSWFYTLWCLYWNLDDLYLQQRSWDICSINKII